MAWLATESFSFSTFTVLVSLAFFACASCICFNCSALIPFCWAASACDCPCGLGEHRGYAQCGHRHYQHHRQQTLLHVLGLPAHKTDFAVVAISKRLSSLYQALSIRTFLSGSFCQRCIRNRIGAAGLSECPQAQYTTIAHTAGTIFPAIARPR